MRVNDAPDVGVDLLALLVELAKGGGNVGQQAVAGGDIVQIAAVAGGFVG